MKRNIIIFLLSISVAGLAQKVKITEGSLAPLKGQTAIKVEFSYDNMTVGKKGQTEKDYLAEKKDEYNKKEAGRGDKWEKAWFADRANRFEPQFRELFAKNSDMTTAGDKPKYTLQFHTTRTEPGWNVGVMRMPAQIDSEVTIVETANPSNMIAKITILKALGQDAMGFDFEAGARLQEGYAKSGKSLGKLFKKELGK